MNHSHTFPLDKSFKPKALQWADQFKYCSLFNSNQTQGYPFGPFKDFLAVGNQQTFSSSGAHDDFDKLQGIINSSNSWLIGHLSYDLKNQIEQLVSNHSTSVEFPLISFFAPAHMIFFEENHIVIQTDDDPHIIYQSILSHKTDKEQGIRTNKTIRSKTSRSTYINTVKRLIDHIVAGDIYEINYCMEYVIDDLVIDPVAFYEELCTLSPTPFSVFYKNKDQYALGASPERYMKKTGTQLISQPIKGTAKRGITHTDDIDIVERLRNDEKERAENMMIVDLVRNDLARSSLAGSVKVEEMFGIYSFKHWHQMISTVSATTKADINIAEIIKNAFPMGSMTGAPKIKVMELIEKYESFKRGLYAGAIGYITPDKDFDFNVVIRTLFYDKKKSKGNFMVGSAITYDSVPENEHQECELKARAIVETLEKCK